MYEVVKDGIILARKITPADIKSGLNFYSKNEEFIQVGIWGYYEEGRYLHRHIHNEFERVTDKTYEVIYLISGRLEAEIFDNDKNFIEKIDVKQGEILVLLESGHGYIITESDTTVLEVKNGPFFGVEKDKTLF